MRSQKEWRSEELPNGTVDITFRIRDTDFLRDYWVQLISGGRDQLSVTRPIQQDGLA